MVFSDHVLPADQRRSLHRSIGRLVGPEVERVAPGHRLASASFVLKGPGPAGAMDWHVDPAITDERIHTSLSFWVPLHDVGAENGALEVLTGGHHATPTDRGGRVRLADTHPPHAEVLARCRAAGGRPSGPLEVAAGHAVAYDHRLPHRSGPNHATRPRVAINVGVLPDRAPLQLNIWRDADPPVEVDVVGLPEGWFASGDLSAPPSAAATR